MLAFVYKRLPYLEYEVFSNCSLVSLRCGRVAVRNGFAAVRSRCIAVVVRGVCGTEPFQGGYGAVWFGYRA